MIQHQHKFSIEGGKNFCRFHWKFHDMIWKVWSKLAKLQTNKNLETIQIISNKITKLKHLDKILKLLREHLNLIKNTRRYHNQHKSNKQAQKKFVSTRSHDSIINYPPPLQGCHFFTTKLWITYFFGFLEKNIVWFRVFCKKTNITALFILLWQTFTIALILANLTQNHISQFPEFIIINFFFTFKTTIFFSSSLGAWFESIIYNTLYQ